MTIPSVESVQDPELRQILGAMRVCLNSLCGIGRDDAAALTRAEARELGILGRDTQGKWFAKAIRDPASMKTQSVTPAVPAVGASVVLAGELDVGSGLATGSHNIAGLILPANAVVTHAWYDVLTAVTGGAGATIALSIPTDDAGGILAATTLAAGFTLGIHAAIPDGTVASFTAKTTAERVVQADVAVSNLTSGRFRVFVQYSVSA